MHNRQVARERRHRRVRKKVRGTPERPRLAVFRSNKHIYAQVIDDVNGLTLASASTVEKDFSGGTAGDDPGTGGRRLQQHACGVVLTDDGVGDRVAGQRHVEQALARLLHALLDRGGHLLRLAVPEAHVARAVTHHHERGEGEPPATLDDLGDPVDGDDSLFVLAFGHGDPSSC